MNRVAYLTLLSTLLFAVLGTMRAVPQLFISDGTNSVTVLDGGMGDANAALGAITWTGTIGTWSVNSVTGITKPTLGYSDLPLMNLTFVDTSSASGTLTLMFTETGFTAPMGAWTNQSIVGTTSGSVKYEIFGAASGPTRDSPFDTTRHLGTLGPLTGTFSAKDAKNYLVTRDPFSLTQVITITHTGSGITNGIATLRLPDDGNSMLLLVSGLSGLGVFRRWRQKRL